MDETDRQLKPNPVIKANFVSRLFFWYLNPLFKDGYKRSLEVSDLHNVVENDASQYLTNKLEKEWDKELCKVKEGRKPSLLRAMVRSFGCGYMLLGLVAFFEEATKVIQPLLLGGLIRYFASESDVTRTEAYLYAAGLSLCAVSLAIFHHPYFYQVQRIGMWLRIACCSLVYKKSLRLSNQALGSTTTGQIVNLLSNDVNRFDQAVLFLHFLWVGPIQAIAVLLILWLKLGPASLAGFGMLILLIPLQTWMGRLFSKLRRKTAVQTDERIRLMNEIVNGMRVIKMYCWETMFGNLVEKVRKQEVRRITASSYARASIQAPFFASAKLIAFLTFTAYALGGNPMTAEVVFVAIGMYNPVRLVMTLFVPFAVQMSTESRVTLERLQEFLLKEELDKMSRVKSSPKRPSPSDCKVVALGMSAAWDEQSSGMTLKDVSFEVLPGELLAVIGPVGSGKSSLLMALLKELPLTAGTLKVEGRVGYVSQQAWVFSASVRQNIIFGQEFDMQRYQRAIKAAALTKDLEMMPEGDQTLIGERGASLSGGQKARVSLARAIYFDADIYLLDDPLSAVDTAVGRHIFEKCINGVLKSKPRILVTHQLQFLKQADKIIILKDGSVDKMGTFEELAEHGVDFAELLRRNEEEDRHSEKGVKDETEKNTLPNGKITVSRRQLDNVIYEEDHKLTNYLSKSFDPKSYLDEAYDVTRSLLTKSKSSRSLYDRKDKLSKPRSRSQLSLSKSVESLSQPVIGSMVSLDADIAGEYVAPVQAEENREAGSVTAGTYLRYFWYGAGMFGLLLLIVLNLAAQVAYVLSDWWLAHWSAQEETREESIMARDWDMFMYNVTNVTVPELDVPVFIYIYLGITVSIFLFGLLRALLMFKILVSSSKILHDRMFHSVVRCPILFFDTNPVGRILNRFSKDIGLLDEVLPLTMFDFLQCFLTIVGIVLVAGIVNPWVFIPTTPLCILFVITRRYFLATSRDIKRLEATTRSPVFTHVSASIQGIHTIRGYGAETQFMKEFHKHQDLHTEAWALFLSTSRWLAVRLDWLCAIFITAVAFCSIIASENLNGGLVGLTLTYAIALMGLFQWAVRQSAEVENQMTSVERVIEYAELPSEAPLDSDEGKAPAPTWPVHGIITGENAKFRYSKEAPPVLKGLNFCVRAQEKVGIVGRTGAGKSSLITMLFRMAEPEGLVCIDGLDICSIGLHDLRKRLSIIPQDPVLFTGSVRRNLDPFDQHSDNDVWRSLEEVQMKQVILDLQDSLQASVSEGGINFSVGQRQLLCLARAVLRQNKILVIDEATANVDPRTDALIQQTIRQKFQNCTVLTIAHRLHTIMDSDRVMVLGEGRILEFDEPYTLLQDDKSHFSQMVEQTGKSESERLLDIAREAYLIRSQPDPNSIIPDSCRMHLTNNVESTTQNGRVELTSIV